MLRQTDRQDRQTDRQTDRAWFSRLLRRAAKKLSGSIRTSEPRNDYLVAVAGRNT